MQTQSTPPVIQLRNVEKVYQTSTIETVALSEVNLRIDRGEFVSVMGPSGCGKSTLLSLMGLLDEPTGGLAQASDIEGSSQSATGGESSGFVGSDGASDSSESLIDDESSDFAKDGQGAAE